MTEKATTKVLIKKLARKQPNEGGWHKHRRGQFFIMNQGLIVLQTHQIRQVISAQKGCWIPANVMHKAISYGQVEADSIYLPLAFGDILPKKVSIFTPTKLLKEVIIRISQWKTSKALPADKLRLLQVMKDELKIIKNDPLSCSMPSNLGLQKQAQRFIATPSLQKSLEEWAFDAHMSKRTFTRHFKEQTGLSFAKWCQQVRIMHAIERLAKGDAISALALDLGYNSVSAFIKVFKAYMGQTPYIYQKGLTL